MFENRVPARKFKHTKVDRKWPGAVITSRRVWLTGMLEFAIGQVTQKEIEASEKHASAEHRDIAAVAL
jgi:hypothetical protein